MLQKMPTNWKRILGPSGIRRLIVVLTILWGVMGLLAHSEGTRDLLKNFADRLTPAIEAIDPWFVVSRVLDYSAGCEKTGLFGEYKCPNDGWIGWLLRLPRALWHTAKDVSAAGWPSTVTGLISLLLGASIILGLLRDPGTGWWHPIGWPNLGLGILLLLLVAGIFTWLLKMVFLGLLKTFGSVVALTGVYSSWIVALDIAYNAVMGWLHVSHASGRGVARA